MVSCAQVGAVNPARQCVAQPPPNFRVMAGRQRSDVLQLPDAGGPSRLLLKSYNDPHLDKFVQAAVVPEGPHAALGKA